MTGRQILVLALLLLAVALILCWPLSKRAELVSVETVPLERPAEQTMVVPTTTTTVAPTTTTTAVARTAPTVRSASVSRATPAYVGSIPDLIRRVFARFGPAVAEQAVRVSFCESRHNPAATNGQHASLFQISRTYHEERARRLGFTWDRMWDPEVNSLVAADIYASSGWQPWTCRHAA